MGRKTTPATYEAIEGFCKMSAPETVGGKGDEVNLCHLDAKDMTLDSIQTPINNQKYAF